MPSLIGYQMMQRDSARSPMTVSAAKLESTPCMICGSVQFDQLFASTDRNRTRRGLFHVVRCNDCGLAFLHPRPSREELAYFYPEDYYRPDLNGDVPSVTFPPQCEAVEWLARWKGVGLLLDVGCATGGFLYAMRERGWEVCGVEISARNAAYCRERLGLDVRTGELIESRFHNNHFDAVTLWHVLEHVPNPKEVLCEVRRVMIDDGMLIICVPNIASAEARIFGRKWYHWDVPRHQFQFTLETLTRLLAQAGFEITRVQYPATSQDFRASFVYAVRDLFQGRWDDRPAQTNAVSAQTRLAPSPPHRIKAAVIHALDMFFSPLCWVLALLRMGGMMTVYARKVVIP